MVLAYTLLGPLGSAPIALDNRSYTTLDATPLYAGQARADPVGGSPCTSIPMSIGSPCLGVCTHRDPICGCSVWACACMRVCGARARGPGLGYLARAAGLQLQASNSRNVVRVLLVGLRL
jgi:hypothetical protein